MELMNVGYLEDFDFDSNGRLINKDIPNDKPVVIMIFASWCPHCVSTKPEFQKFANEMKDKVFCAAIQADGERESEKKLMEKIESIKPGFRGFPDFVLYKNGERVNKEIQGRTVESFVQFAQ